MNTEALDRIVFGAFGETVTTPERPDTIEWCEANRTLRGAHGGPWRRDYCKRAIEIMRAAADRTTRTIVIRGAAQIAGCWPRLDSYRDLGSRLRRSVVQGDDQ